MKLPQILVSTLGTITLSFTLFEYVQDGWLLYQKIWSWTCPLVVVCDLSQSLDGDLHVESSLVSQTVTAWKKKQEKYLKILKAHHDSYKLIQRICINVRSSACRVGQVFLYVRWVCMYASRAAYAVCQCAVCRCTHTDLCWGYSPAGGPLFDSGCSVICLRGLRTQHRLLWCQHLI